MGEVGEGDDALLTDTQHLVQHQVRAAQHLQCLGHNHHIEAAVLEVGQPLVQVLLNDIDALTYTGGDIVGVDLQSIALYLLALLEGVQ